VLERIEAEYRRRTPRSAEKFKEISQYIAGGASRGLVVLKPHPPVMVEGAGARFTDLDGNQYIDFVSGTEGGREHGILLIAGEVVSFRLGARHRRHRPAQCAGRAHAGRNPGRAARSGRRRAGDRRGLGC